MRFIIDKEEQKRILDSCHKHPTSGHMGTKKTLARITERFMWPGVTKDVYQLVSYLPSCHIHVHVVPVCIVLLLFLHVG